MPRYVRSVTLLVKVSPLSGHRHSRPVPDLSLGIVLELYLKLLFLPSTGHRQPKVFIQRRCFEASKVEVAGRGPSPPFPPSPAHSSICYGIAPNWPNIPVQLVPGAAGSAGSADSTSAASRRPSAISGLFWRLSDGIVDVGLF